MLTKRDFIKSFVYGFLFLISKPFGLVSNFSDNSHAEKYWEACQDEMIALAPKGYNGPYILTAEQINKYEKAWLKANETSGSLREWKIVNNPALLYSKWWTE